MTIIEKQPLKRSPLRKQLAALSGIVVFSAAMAAPLPPSSKAEVDALLAALESSGCEFNRNGSWHNAGEAKKHLLRKLEYLEKKNAIRDTEGFIELAASASSSSGKPYQVRCGGNKPIDSKTWMHAQLKTIRTPAAAK